VLHEQLVQPWDLCNTPLQRGKFQYSMRYLRLSGITLYREKFELGCRIRGLSPAETCVIAIPLSPVANSSYWGRRAEEPSMLAMLPGGIDVTLAGGHAQVVALIDSSLVRSHLPPHAARALELAATRHFLPAQPKDVCRLGRWLSALIDRAHRKPEMLRNPAVQRWMTAAILEGLSSAVGTSLDAPSRPRPSARRRGLDRALAYLRHADASSLTIPEIARAACVSQRTLEYAFRETFGLTPVALIRLHRLHAARRDLWRNDPAHTTVTEIALRNGFHHLARFSKLYRETFGEAPSATLGVPGDPGDLNTSPLVA
jgi:AraC family ethanolamine operon transcriptional activator